MSDNMLPYKLYLHNSYTQAESAAFAQEQGIEFANEQAKDRFDPGYEVGLECRVDPETGRCFAIGILEGNGDVFCSFPAWIEV